MLTLAGSGFAVVAHAQSLDPVDIRACTAVESDAQRLACYDQATGRANLPAAQKRSNPEVSPPVIFGHEHHSVAATEPDDTATPPVSLLDSRWELARESKLGTFNLRGYKPVYLLPVFATNDQNKQPHSPNPDNTVAQSEKLDNVETKFQLSLKTKVWQNIFGDNGDLWVAYTQSSRWQLYNAKQSRPFRETDYEPEVMLVFNTHYNVLGWDGRLLGVSINHQSNGRNNPLSRSWNRVIASVGFERNDWTIMLRPWWRIAEPRGSDDNPDISDYMGRADMQIVHEWHGQEFGLLLRHSLRSGDRSHGSAKFSWSFPLRGNLRGYMEVFNGYGESLIDYNHNATYLGVGVSLLDWY
ncbi:MAG: phospholipase A [Rhodanobacter sp.]